MGSRRDSANRQSTANDRSGCHICYCWTPCCCDCCCGSGERQQPSTPVSNPSSSRRSTPVPVQASQTRSSQTNPSRQRRSPRQPTTHQTSRLGRLVRTFHALPRIFHGRPLHRAPRAGTMTLYPRLHPLPPNTPTPRGFREIRLHFRNTLTVLDLPRTSLYHRYHWCVRFPALRSRCKSRLRITIFGLKLAPPRPRKQDLFPAPPESRSGALRKTLILPKLPWPCLWRPSPSQPKDVAMVPYGTRTCPVCLGHPTSSSRTARFSGQRGRH